MFSIVIVSQVTDLRSNPKGLVTRPEDVLYLSFMSHPKPWDQYKSVLPSFSPTAKTFLRSHANSLYYIRDIYATFINMVRGIYDPNSSIAYYCGQLLVPHQPSSSFSAECRELYCPVLYTKHENTGGGGVITTYGRSCIRFQYEWMYVRIQIWSILMNKNNSSLRRENFASISY